MIRAVDDSPIREEDFQAYVDGLLEVNRRAAVESYLGRHPREAERVTAYRAQNILMHEAFDRIAEAPLSVPLEELKNKFARSIRRRHAARRLGRWAAAAASIAIVASAALVGYQRFYPVLTANDAPTAFSRLAIEAHALLTGEASPPLTEKGPEGGNALVGWLSQRETKTSRPAPILKQFGLEISGGRIFLMGERPVVQLVYGGKGQQKLSLYVGASPTDDRQNVFTFVQQGDLSTFYWRQPKLEFSLVGTLGRDELMTIAKAVHEQLNSGEAESGTRPNLNKILRRDGDVTQPTGGTVPETSRPLPGGGKADKGSLSKMPFVVLEKK